MRLKGCEPKGGLFIGARRFQAWLLKIPETHPLAPTLIHFLGELPHPAFLLPTVGKSPVALCDAVR